MSTEYVDVREAAAILKASTKTVRRRISDGSIPAIRLGHLVRIRREDLDNVGRRIPSARAS